MDLSRLIAITLCVGCGNAAPKPLLFDDAGKSVTGDAGSDLGTMRRIMDAATATAPEDASQALHDSATEDAETVLLDAGLPCVDSDGDRKCDVDDPCPTTKSPKTCVLWSLETPSDAMIGETSGDVEAGLHLVASDGINVVGHMPLSDALGHARIFDESQIYRWGALAARSTAKPSNFSSIALALAGAATARLEAAYGGQVQELTPLVNVLLPSGAVVDSVDCTGIVHSDGRISFLCEVSGH